MDEVGYLPVRERLDRTSYAVASFLARYRGMTLRAYQQDMRAFLQWCDERHLAPLEAERPHLELYLRWMEGRGYAPATMGRRFGCVAGFYQFAVLDGHLSANPTIAVTRPRVLWESQRRTVLHPLEYAALLTAARHDGPQAHALVALLGMLGLRVSEACHASIGDLTYESGYELLTVMGKGDKPARIPLPVPVLRAVKEAIDGRAAGPVLTNTRGGRLSPSSASGQLSRLTKQIGWTIRSARTACGAPSAPLGSLRECRSETCSTPCVTPTAVQPCATTWPG
jgi:integrase/recombinase XerD